MSIGTPVSLGTASIASGTSLALTTTASASAGSVIVVFASSGGNNVPNSVSDTINSYAASAIANSAGTGRSRMFATAPITAALASGSTITVTYGASGQAKLMSAFAISGPSSRDIAGAGASGSSTAPSIATGALGWPSEIVLAYTHVVAGAADTFTEASGFTSLASVLSTDALRAAYRIVSSAAGVTYAPTLGTSRTWGANLVTFVAQDGAGRAFAPRQTFLTL